MRCPGCQADNREGARFCRECGFDTADLRDAKALLEELA